MVNETVLSIPERVAVLETRMTNVEHLLEQIDHKLDDLIEFKSKGMGAVGLVGVLITSGIVGVVLTVINMFRPHL